MRSLKDGKDKVSSIDMTECENILKDFYRIDKNVSLIILKFIKKDGNSEGQTLQYEVYHPFENYKLNLSLCENTTVDIYVPLELSEEAEKILKNLVDQGYDPFDLNDKFYREICTPYTSENGTDVLLDDREEFIYSTLVNASLCPSGCDYSEYSLDNKYIKCECGTNNTDIVTLDIEHLSGKNVYKSFLSTMKSTNYKVMICYNLVFNFKIFCHNYGSIITLILFAVYIIFMIYYCFRDITPIKISVSKILFDEEELENLNNIHLIELSQKKGKGKTKFKEKNRNGNFPPKKGKIIHTKSEKNTLHTENYESVESPKTKIEKPKKNRKKGKKSSTKRLIKNESNNYGVKNDIQKKP